MMMIKILVEVKDCTVNLDKSLSFASVLFYILVIGSHLVWPRGATPHQGQGQRPRVPGCNGTGTAERNYLASEVRGGSREEIPSVRGQGRRREELPCVRGQGRRPGGDTPRPKPEARGGGREDQPHVQRAMAAWAQEGLEELFHIEGQEGRW